MKSYKIGWVADYTVKEHRGGAQQTNEVMVLHGRGLGHRVTYISPQSVNEIDYKKFDLIVLNNVTMFSDDILMDMAENVPCVRYEHDYAFASRAVMSEIARLCRVWVFLSPLHEKTFCDISQKKITNAEIIPSPVSPDVFKIDERIIRKLHSYIFSGQLCGEKGIDQFIEYVQQKPRCRFHVCGWGNDSYIKSLEAIDNVVYHGSVSHRKLVSLYNQSQFFYHRPNWKEPFGRSVLEAYLCGCSLVVNSNVGAMSCGIDFDDYRGVQKLMRGIPDKFWKTILHA